MLLAITKKELERVESKVLPTTFRKRYEDRIDWFIFGVYCLIILAFFVGAFYVDIALPKSLFLIFLFSAPTAMIVIAISKPIKKYLIENKKFYTNNIREAMIDRLKSFYLPDNNIELLKTLYEKSLLKKDQKEQIEQFLTIHGKTIVDYLGSLGDKNLAMMSEPYREQIDKDINEAVESYFIGKSRELELQIMAENSRKSDEEKFKEDCLKFFYSTMPKNIASPKDRLCC
jgi:hypothetical protein